MYLRVVGWGLAVLLGCSTGLAWGQAAGKACPIHSAPASEAEAAFAREEYDKGLELFEKLASSAPDESRNGVIRVLLGQGKLEDAAKSAEAWVSSEPASADALETMAEVLFREGELPRAYEMNQKAHALDHCNARVYLTDARYEEAVGNFATARGHLAVAHDLSPTDPEIRWEWIGTLPQLDAAKEWSALLAEGNLLNDDDSAWVRGKIEFARSATEHDCSAGNAPSQATVPIRTIHNGPNHIEGFALDVMLNGRRRRLEIDTAVDGILLSPRAAQGLGLPVEQTAAPRKGQSVRSHADTVRVGDVEYHHCRVAALDKRTNPDIDGWIGPNLFARYLVTLDFPRKQMQLSPLPTRPEGSVTRTTSNEELGEVGKHDRYVAPEMRDWMPVYRFGEDLLLPVRITNGSEDIFAPHQPLFVVVTSTGTNYVSRRVAGRLKEVSSSRGSKLGAFPDDNGVFFVAGNLSLNFAHLKLGVENLYSLDTTQWSNADGTEIAGYLSTSMVSQLAIHIDYRDNLIRFEYPKPR